MADQRFQPVSGMELPRFAGIPTFMRLPHVQPEDDLYKKTEIGFVGIPWDGGTTNRPGARHGPRQIRDYTTMIRSTHPISMVKPFEMCNCADLGDVSPNPSGLEDTLERVRVFYERLRKDNITPISVGGDHLTSLPVLRGLADGRTLSMIHFDAHTDLFEGYFGGTMYTHGTPFRRAIEEGLLDPERVVQIGIRGTMYDGDDIEWGREQGVTIIGMDEARERGYSDVMKQARKIVGDTETYVSFDIDFIDPAFAPGTGTPEIGGPDTWTAQQYVRELAGVDIIGADLVEVSPPFDQSGGTAWVAASILFEILCIVTQTRKGRGA